MGYGFPRAKTSQPENAHDRGSLHGIDSGTVSQSGTRTVANRPPRSAGKEAGAIIASEEDNDNFYISAARLTQIENEPSIPSVFKLFSLCSVYGLDLHDVLSKFGVNANRVHSYRSRFLPETTRVTSAEVYGFEDKVLVPVRIDPSFRWETTQLINRVVALWERFAPLLINRNTRRRTYGYVGLTDKTMYPLLRPGSLIMMDPERTRGHFAGM